MHVFCFVFVSLLFFFQEIIKNVKLNFSLAAAIAVNATSTVRAAGSPDVVFLAFVCCVCCTAFRSAEISFQFIIYRACEAVAAVWLEATKRPKGE